MEKLINDFSVGLFFWQTVLFVILVFVLRKYAWKPILSAVEEREEGIKNSLEAAEHAKAEMEKLNADNERVLAEARVERDALLKEAREIKESIVNEAKDLANSEADKILASAKEQIANEKMKAITELKNTVATLSIDIAEKVLKSELSDKTKQNKLVASVLKESQLN
ncbi:MAG: ATP synthase F0 subunit B [Flavobacteriales bacterium]|nr:ATP synthase F0 subunit B [Flavobacteriales bacterium]|tara:strand:- start:21054 stop:21554 length:501 start_codon:yes stop_codon:yes gene_type:complete